MSKKKFKILAASDIEGDSAATKKLANKAKKEGVDLVVLAGDLTGWNEGDEILKPFIDKGQRVVFVPGNHDTSEMARFLTELYGVKNVGNHYVKYEDVGVIGVGSPDGQLSIDEKKAFSKLKADFKKVKDLEKKIMVSHLNAAGTKSEFSGFEGSTGVRKAVEELQPDVLIHGHIHEAEGLSERIGKTRVYSVGKKGKVIEL